MRALCFHAVPGQLAHTQREQCRYSHWLPGRIVDLHRIAGAQYLYGGRWGKHLRNAGFGAGQFLPIGVVVLVPDREVITDNDGGSGGGGNENSVRQTLPGNPMLSWPGALVVQLRIHVFGVTHCTTVRFGPQRPVRVVRLAPAFSAWAVSSGQRDGFVEKEQRR